MSGKMIIKRIKRILYILPILTIWYSPAFSIDTLDKNPEPNETVTLYSNLSQNIAQEANLFSEYRTYSENARLPVFWDNLKNLNLSRDEIILTIRFLERSLEETITHGETGEDVVYLVRGNLSITSNPEASSQLFSHWRPFYFLISGGFFLIISALVMMAMHITSGGNVSASQLKDFEGLEFAQYQL